MKDPRVEALAQILVRYSTKVEPGAVTGIQSSTIAEPLVQAVYEEVLRAGGHPVFQIAPTGAQPAFYELAGDDQLDFVAPPQRWAYTDSDVRIAIMAEANPRSLSRADPAEQVKRLADWIEGREEVHVVGPGTDVRLNVSGRHWIPCFGSHNMPDGEFFTGPVEDGVNGEVSFSFPAVYGGREVTGVRFRFEDGKVVDASAERGEEYLHEMLDP